MEKKMNKRTLRIILGASISLVSLVLGVVAGVKIGRYVGLSQQTPGNNNNNTNNLYSGFQFSELLSLIYSTLNNLVRW